MFQEQSCLQTGEGREMVGEEAVLTLAMDHPNVVSAYALVVDEWGEAEGMAMEYLEGGDLFTALV